MGGFGNPWSGMVVVVVVSGSLEQETSIRASIESAEVRMIDFFIARIASSITVCSTPASKNITPIRRSESAATTAVLCHVERSRDISNSSQVSGKKLIVRDPHYPR